jgi:hypothetical protein
MLNQWQSMEIVPARNRQHPLSLKRKEDFPMTKISVTASIIAIAILVVPVGSLAQSGGSAGGGSAGGGRNGWRQRCTVGSRQYRRSEQFRLPRLLTVCVALLASRFLEWLASRFLESIAPKSKEEFSEVVEAGLSTSSNAATISCWTYLVAGSDLI